MAIQYADDESFKEQIKEGFVIVDFFSTTCVPCKAFSRILEELDAELPFIHIVKVNTTDYPKLAKENRIFAVPTVQFYKDGEKKYENVGVMEVEEIKKKITEFMYGSVK